MAKLPFGSMQKILTDLGIKPGSSNNQTPPNQPSEETPKPNDPAVTENVLNKVFNTKPSQELSAKDDKITTKADGEIIKGMTKVDQAQSTLNSKDKIEGGAGKDTLIVELEGRFSGFDSEGGVSGVEHIAIKSDERGQDFKAKGISGTKEYTLEGNVSLSEVGDVEKINIVNMAKDAKISFAKEKQDKFKDGESDTLNIAVDNVGTAPVKEGQNPHYSKINIQDVENLNLTATGKDSFVENASALKVTIDGAGNLSFKTASNSKLENLDASKAKGKVSVDLTAGGRELEKVLLGSANDTLNLNIASANNLETIDMGDGKDNLVVNGSGNLSPAQVSGVETLTLGRVNGATRIDGQAFGSLEKIVVSKDVSGDTSIESLSAPKTNVEIQGENSNAKTITVENENSLSVLFTGASAKATAKNPTANSMSVNAGDSTYFEMEVAEKMLAKGNVTADKAEEAKMALKGGMREGTLKLDAANKLSVTTGEMASDFVLNSPNLTALGVIAGEGGLEIKTGSTLTSLESLEVNTKGIFEIDAAMAKANTIDLGGQGAVKLGDIGSTALENSVSITANGLADVAKTGEKALEIGAINTKQEAVTLKTNVKGSVKTGDIGASGNLVGDVTLDVGSEGVIDMGAIYANSITGTSATSRKQASGDSHVIKVGAMEAKEKVELNLTAPGGKLDLDTIKGETGVSLNLTAENVDVGNISKTTTALAQASVSVTAKKAVVGDIEANEVSVDLSNVKESVTLGAINVKDSLTIVNGKTDLGTGEGVAVTTGGVNFVANLTGNKGNEKLKFAVSDADGDRSITLSGDLGRGDEDMIKVDTTADTNSKFTIDLTGVASKTAIEIKTKETMEDTIKLGNGKETVVLALSGTLDDTKADTIENFNIRGDKIKVDGITITGVETLAKASDSGTASPKTTVEANKLYVVDMSSTSLTGKDFGEAAFAEIFADNGAYVKTTTGTGSGTKALFAVVGSDKTQIYAHQGADTTLSEDEVTLVAVIDGSLRASDITADIFA